MALGLPLEVCLRVDDDILRLSGTDCSGEIDEIVAKSLLFIFEYILNCCVLGKTEYLRTIVAEKPTLT